MCSTIRPGYPTYIDNTNKAQYTMKGFTLIEVWIALLLLTGLVLLGFSSGAFVKHQNEGQVLGDEIRRAVQYAKIQAISLGHSLLLSSIDDSPDWSKGMRLTLYHGKILYLWHWDHSFWKVAWLGTSSRGIIFSNNPTSAMSNGRFILSNAHTKECFVLIINRLGRLGTLTPLKSKGTVCII